MRALTLLVTTVLFFAQLLQAAQRPPLFDPILIRQLTENLHDLAYGDDEAAAERIADFDVARPEITKAKPQANTDFLADTAADLCQLWPSPEQLRLTKRLPTTPCAGFDTELVVHTGTQTLFLCKNGEAVANFDVSFGEGGFDKRRRGDQKTPLGVYELSAPYPSEKFGTFIPIGYPTPAQEKAGYTGDMVGVHGPGRFARCWGFWNVVGNWTDGCVAVASDRMIKEIARFVRANRVRKITILPPAR